MVALLSYLLIGKSIYSLILPNDKRNCWGAHFEKHVTWPMSQVQSAAVRFALHDSVVCRIKRKRVAQVSFQDFLQDNCIECPFHFAMIWNCKLCDIFHKLIDNSEHTPTRADRNSCITQNWSLLWRQQTNRDMKEKLYRLSITKQLYFPSITKITGPDKLV